MTNIARITAAMTAALVLLLVHPEHASAETAAGNVTDSRSGMVIAGATVQVPAENVSARTGDNGRFIISGLSRGEYTLTVTADGYTPAEVTVTVPDASLTIPLTPEPYRVEPVVSTVRGRDTGVSQIPGSVAVVGAVEFTEDNPVSIAGTIAREPGLDAAMAMPWSQRVTIRGLSRDHVAVLVDGNRVVTANAVPAQFGLVPPADIERVEILKGPLSVLYGSGSTGGVVNIITKHGAFTPDRETSATIQPAYESANAGLSLYESVAASNARFHIRLSQSNRIYHDYHAADGERIPNSQFEDRQTQLSFGMKLTGRHTLDVRWQSFDVFDAGIPGGAAFPPGADVRYPSSSRDLVDLTWRWRPRLPWWQSSETAVYYQPVDRLVRIHPNQVKVIPDTPAEGRSMRVTPLETRPAAEHLVSGFLWRNVLAFGGHTVVAGVEGWQKKMETERVKIIRKEVIDSESGNVLQTMQDTTVEQSVPDSRQRPVGVFLEDSFDAGDRFHLTLGGRIDHIHTGNDPAYTTVSPPSDDLLWEEHSDDDLSWSMVAGGVWEAASFADVSLTAARAFRAPTIEERYMYIDLGKTPVDAGNPDLDPERGTFFELGTTLTAGTATADIRGYVNDIRDMVVLRPGGTFNGKDANVYTNAGRVLLRGGELSLSWVARENLLLSGDVSYTRGTDEDTGNDLPFMPPANGHLSARWNVLRTVWIEPLITLTGRQTTTAPGETETAGYSLLDISGGWRFPAAGNLGGELVAGVRNLTDKRYVHHLTESRTFPLYGMGRSVYVSARLTLH